MGFSRGLLAVGVGVVRVFTCQRMEGREKYVPLLYGVVVRDFVRKGRKKRGSKKFADFLAARLYPQPSRRTAPAAEGGSKGVARRDLGQNCDGRADA